MMYDVIILGAGPNGLAAALALGGHCLQNPLRVLLLDHRDPHVIPDDSRGTALTQATQMMFRTLGVPLDGEVLCPMRDIIVTDGVAAHDQRPTLLSLATASEQSAAAAMIENRVLIEALLAAVKASPHITLHPTSGDHARARLLIAADGRGSKVRAQLALPVTQHDYKQTALSFAITHGVPHNNLAEEHFSPDGVFAVLPLAGDACSIVWGTSPEEAARLMALDVSAFEAALQQRMGPRLGQVHLRGKRATYPLVMQLAERFIAPRVALLGDAAHAIHPLAGLGLNLGFKDAAALADILFQAVHRGEDHGSDGVLERYQQARRFDTVMTSFAMDGMNALFANDNPVLKTLRSTGLRVVDQVPQAKHFFMGQAAGVSQENPMLMQGLLPG
jgi:2-octaprenyl-6-methoxyphenol hydroxylase